MTGVQTCALPISPPCNRIQSPSINSRLFNMRRLSAASAGRLAALIRARILGQMRQKRHYRALFYGYFCAYFRLDLPQIWPHRGEPTRGGCKRNRTRIYSPIRMPCLVPPPPSAAPSAFHRRFVSYHRPPRRLRPTPVHGARKRLAHIALRLYDERCVCFGCFRRLR